MSDLIRTLREDGKPGENIPKHAYDRWSQYILSSLSGSDELTLNELLENAFSNSTTPQPQTDSRASWYILQIKRDLEARGFIKVLPASTNKRAFMLRLTRQGRESVKRQK